MADTKKEMVANLNLKFDYKTYRYFIDASGSVISQLRDKNAVDKTKNVVAANAFTREKGYFYFLTKEGNVVRTALVGRKKKEVVAAA